MLLGIAGPLGTDLATCGEASAAHDGYTALEGLVTLNSGNSTTAISGLSFIEMRSISFLTSF